ncbi:hypothetical protein CerSpe_124090 [Prunus speciosa]
MKNVVKECANGISNQTACCRAMDSYVSQLQQQSFVTNLEALNSAASLARKVPNFQQYPKQHPHHKVVSNFDLHYYVQMIQSS